MKAYMKPEFTVKSFESTETFADLVTEDVFGTGVDVPVTTYTLSDVTSA